MLPSWRLALNTLAGRPVRTGLMIGAIAIAAALVMAIACAQATVQASMSHGITKFVGNTDARIIHQGNGRFEEPLLEQVRAWPEVDVASGRLGASLTLIHADGRTDPETGELLRITPTAIGVEFENETRFRIREITRGTFPAKPDEILIDEVTAEQLRTEVGDVLEIQRFGDPILLTVAGIFTRPRLGTIQRPLVEIDRTVLAEATDRPAELSAIVIILKDGVNVEAFCAAHQAELPGILSLEPAELVRSGFDRQIVASRLGLLVASIFSFISASFIIVTALTTSVTERQREMAVTRCIGASRGQLFGSQLMAGIVLAGAGAIIGVPLGIGLTAVLTWYFAEYLPAGLHVHALGLQLATIGSFGAGILGALYPAIMSSRVAPLQAMSIRAQPVRAMSIIICSMIGCAFIALQLGLFRITDPSDRFLAYVYAGLPCLLMGYFALAVPLLTLISTMISPVLSGALRLPAGMLGRSMRVMPFRQGFTAGALMVGTAILVSTWSNMTSILDDWLREIKFADGFAFRTAGISPAEQHAIASLPFVSDVCVISYLPVRVYDRQIFGVQGLAPPNVTCMGFDPDKFFAMNTVQWAAGDPANAIARLKDGTGLIVADRFLPTQKVKIGDTLTIGVGKTKKSFEIVGAVSSAGLDIATQSFGIRSQYMEFSISCVFVDQRVVEDVFDNRDVLIMQLNLKSVGGGDSAVVPLPLRGEGGVRREMHDNAESHAASNAATSLTDEQILAAISEVAPGVMFHSGRWITKTINEVATAMMIVQSVVAFAALVLASLGVGNVILANIHGRRYEYGVLRAVGGHRSLLARLIFGEAIMLAITGALIGTLLGMHLAWVGVHHYRELAGLPLRLILPQWPTVFGWLTVIALTLLAALPGVWSVVRRQPAALLASGRNG